LPAVGTNNEAQDLVTEGTCMKKINSWLGGIKIGLGTALLVTLLGCVGYVDGGGGAVVVPGPDVTIFGGGFDRGHAVRDYSHRGAVSRGFAHGRR
jgi:hypothetical protein